MRPTSSNPIEEAEMLAKSIPKYVYEAMEFRACPSLGVPDKLQNMIWFAIPRDSIEKILMDYSQSLEKSR